MKKLIYQLLNFFLTIEVISGSYLWCHQGGNKDYSPVQCSPQTLECFKFVCEGIESEFVARGCGVDVKTRSVGLKNESCFQAESVCQQLGGISTCHLCNNKYMCNGSNSLLKNLYFNVFIYFLTIYIIIANF